MADYLKGVNLARDQITDDVRVSTAYFPAKEGIDWHDSPLWETWIFGPTESGISRQYVHRNERDALRRHPLIVKAARSVFAKTGEGNGNG
jgi:hypothetical protein